MADSQSSRVRTRHLFFSLYLICCRYRCDYPSLSLSLATEIKLTVFSRRLGLVRLEYRVPSSKLALKMVHRVDSGVESPVSENSCWKKSPVKAELEASDDEDNLCSLSKRPKLDLSNQVFRILQISSSLLFCVINVICSKKNQKEKILRVYLALKFDFKQGYKPLEEPSPLGLKLKKSPSFLDLIHMKLSQEKSAPLAKTLLRKEKGSSANADKLKASNFPASLLKIGTWEVRIYFLAN